MDKIAGHTMGTPEYTLEEAITLFERIGLDGIEIVVQDNYKCGLKNDTGIPYLKKIKDTAATHHLEISCLTPYFNQYNNLDDRIRNADILGLKKVIDYAEYLECRFIRIYGGSFIGNEKDENGEKERRLVEAMQYLGDYAKQKNINLVIEDHFNTMTVTAAKATAIVKKINRENVGILYDQVNLAFVSAEEYKEAIYLQKDFIKYVHVKDMVFKGSSRNFKAESVSHVDENERIVRSRVVGCGIMDWKGIINELRSIGYSGWYSLEYERRWHPDDLPIADEGMAEGARHLRECLK